MRRLISKLGWVAISGLSSLSVAQDHDEQGRTSPIEFESDSFSLDRPTNTMTFQGFRIDTGQWRLRADQASALATELDFTAGEWHFSGNISVSIDSTVMTAEKASFAFRDRMLVNADLIGSPVAFEDTSPEREGPVRGHAEHIQYDHDAGTVRLIGQVSLSVGPYDTTGCDLIYFLDEENFTTGSSECDTPFTMTIEASERTTESSP